MIRLLIAILIAALLSACASSRNAHYAAQSEYRTAIAAQNAAKLAAVQSAASDCKTDTCRVSVAAMAALVQSERVERPAQYRSQAGTVLGLVERALSVGAAVYGQKIQGDSLVDLAGVIAGSAGDRSQHFDYSDHSATDNSVSIADSYNEQGDTISDSGNTTIADSYNTPTEIDVSGDGSVVGDGNVIDNSETVIDDHSCNPGTIGCNATVTPEIDP